MEQSELLYEGFSDGGQSMMNQSTCVFQQPEGSRTMPIEFNTEIFIDLVQNESCLWNTSIRSYNMYKEQGREKTHGTK